MRLEAFYKKSNDDEIEKLLKEQEELLKKENWSFLEGENGIELLGVQIGQDERVKNEKAYKFLLEVLYPRAKEMAMIQGGDLTLDIDEEKHTAKMEYRGEYLMKTVNDVVLNKFLVPTMLSADQYFFKAEKDILVIEFLFNLYVTAQNDIEKEL